MANLNETPTGERMHIGFFGMRNAGKSSLVNAITGQELSIVSDILGTTTDPVRKTMELLPLGPVVIIDTPGFDDEGELGQARVQKAREALRGCDIAVLVVDGALGFSDADRAFLEVLKASGKAYCIVQNKADLMEDAENLAQGEHEFLASAETGEGIGQLKEALARLVKDDSSPALVSDLVKEGDMVVLVIPIDESAPKGRIILPQQMVIRDLLNAGAMCSVCQPQQLKATLEDLTQPPRLVVTDSQVFEFVASVVPESVELTSFSILMARYKGELNQLLQGTDALDNLQDGSRVLIAEGCTHHRQCKDIGTVKMPAWIRQHCDAQPDFEFTSGREFPAGLESYDVIVHCGGCMLNRTEMQGRMTCAEDAEVPMVNYGMAIAHMHGILDRALKPFESLF